MLPAAETIQGRTAGSSYEMNFARSLHKYGWEFQYQVPMFGGSQVLGGTIIDFVVSTMPKATPVYIQGEYWHQGARAERDKLMMAFINSRLRKYYNTVKEIYGESVRTQESSDATVLREFGRAT